MRRSRHPLSRRSSSKTVESQLRIIGGEFRGRTVLYNGDPGLRPMKDRVRESLFNLIGPHVVGKSVIDLFAGTGALAFESLSRGARSAICIERRFPNAKTIAETATNLGLLDRVILVTGDAFQWVKRHTLESSPPWLVFCCPPYEFYESRHDEMLELIKTLWRTAPPESFFAIESDARFSPTELPEPDLWKVRKYPPAILSLAEKRNDEG